MAWTKQKRLDLNPSSADRWTTCTASPKFILDNWDKLPVEDKTFADPGTTAHEVAAALLENRKPNPKECPVPIEPEMHQHAWDYAEFVEGLIEPGGKLLVEQKLPLFYMEGRNAKIDAAVINPTNLHIVDYKYGEGIIVSPENNLQATIYAKSVVWNWSKYGFPGKQVGNGMSWAFDGPDDFPIFITIYQPRTREGAPFHTWQTTWGEIRKQAKEIFKIASGILTQQYPVDGAADNDLVFAPSDKACQWCPAKGFCTARQQTLVADLDMLAVIDDTDKPAPGVLTMKQLAAIVKHGDHIKKWVDDAQKFALQHMRNGGKIPGFKLVMSRGGNRYWMDEKKVTKYLLADTILREEEILCEPSLVSPSQIEKLLGKGKFPARVYNLISRSPGQPIIAPEDDPRESAFVDAASEFEILDL